MAGDVKLRDRLTYDDIRNLRAVGFGVTVLLDLTHSPKDKHIHLEIEVDYRCHDQAEFDRRMSTFKQRSGPTFKKLLVGKFNPSRKRYTAKYEAEWFSRNIVSKASNAKELAHAIESARSGAGPRKMIKVKC